MGGAGSDEEDTCEHGISMRLQCPQCVADARRADQDRADRERSDAMLRDHLSAPAEQSYDQELVRDAIADLPPGARERQERARLDALRGGLWATAQPMTTGDSEWATRGLRDSPAFRNWERNKSDPDARQQSDQQTGRGPMASVAEVKAALAQANQKMGEVQSLNAQLGLEVDEAHEVYAAAFEGTDHEQAAAIRSYMLQIGEEIEKISSLTAAAVEAAQTYVASI